MFNYLSDVILLHLFMTPLSVIGMKGIHSTHKIPARAIRKVPLAEDTWCDIILNEVSYLFLFKS